MLQLLTLSEELVLFVDALLLHLLFFVVLFLFEIEALIFELPHFFLTFTCLIYLSCFLAIHSRLTRHLAFSQAPLTAGHKPDVLLKVLDLPLPLFGALNILVLPILLCPSTLHHGLANIHREVLLPILILNIKLLLFHPQVEGLLCPSQVHLLLRDTPGLSHVSMLELQPLFLNTNIRHLVLEGELLLVILPGLVTIQSCVCAGNRDAIGFSTHVTSTYIGITRPCTIGSKRSTPYMLSNLLRRFICPPERCPTPLVTGNLSSILIESGEHEITHRDIFTISLHVLYPDWTRKLTSSIL